MGKQGTEYELFVKEVYEYLNRADGLSDVKIQHDVILKGAAGVGHQIDVYWTFCKAGVAYKVAVECKDYKTESVRKRLQLFMIFCKILAISMEYLHPKWVFRVAQKNMRKNTEYN